jgi:predicted DNA-binding protein with PD1-like motif
MLRVPAALGQPYLLRLAHGADLLEEIERHVQEAGIRLGWLWGLGAVSRGALAYYDQEGQAYKDIVLDRRLEIAGLTGNVSELQGQPMVHAHVTFADEEGRTYAGHLTKRSIVFAAEVLLVGLQGPALIREQDEQTGLRLWAPPAPLP